MEELFYISSGRPTSGMPRILWMTLTISDYGTDFLKGSSVYTFIVPALQFLELVLMRHVQVGEYVNSRAQRDLNLAALRLPCHTVKPSIRLISYNPVTSVGDCSDSWPNTTHLSIRSGQENEKSWCD